MVYALLSDMRVLEVTSGIAGASTARFLADGGADVIVVESVTGGPARRLGPFPNDEPHQESSAWFLHLNTNKRGVTLNVGSGTGRQLLQRLLAQCDVLIEDLSAEEADAIGVNPDSLLSAFPNLVIVSVTPFGRTGPYANYKASDVVLQAMGCFMHCNGRPDLPPISVPWEQAAQFGGRAAAVAAMLAFTHQRSTGEGQHVDFSLWECLASESPMHVSTYAYSGAVETRGRGYHRAVMDGELQECKDGWIALTCDGGNPWEMSAVFFDAPELIDERFAGRYGRLQHYEKIEEIIGPKLKQRGKWDLFNQGIKERFVFGPVQTPEEVMECPQLEAREAWVEVEHPIAGRLKHPGLGFQMTGHQQRWWPAPMLGQHNEEVYCGELGLSRQELVRLQQLGIVSHGGQITSNEVRFRRPIASSSHRYAPDLKENCKEVHGAHRFPLQGIRVVALENVVQLPWTTRVLADMGAEVIRVENISRLETRRWRPFPDNDPGDRWWDRSGSYHTLGRNKKSVTLDLQQPEGVELLRRLIAVSDVLAENHRPGVLERLGLGYEALRQIKPDLIVLRSSGFGQNGPWRQAGAFGRTIQPLSGLYHFIGFEEGSPMRCEDSYHDILTGWNNALAILMALHHRRRTGTGAYIDMSMFETGVSCIGPALLALQMGVTLQGRMGNSHPFMAPHGCYPCCGKDAWVVISVSNDKEWLGLQRAIGAPAWAQEPRYRDADHRWQNRKDLDHHLTSWTSGFDKHEVMHLLQRHGVPAGPVLMARDILTDPHLRQRGFIQWFTHPPERGVGRRPFLGSPFRLSRVLPRVRFIAGLGEHNREVLGDLLGVNATKLQAYESQGIIGTVPRDEEFLRPQLPSLEEFVAQEQWAYYDLDYQTVLG